MKGDGFQNGGALIVDKNGKQLYEYIQEDAADHISAEEIFKALNIKPQLFYALIFLYSQTNKGTKIAIYEHCVSCSCIQK